MQTTTTIGLDIAKSVFQVHSDSHLLSHSKNGDFSFNRQQRRH
jgi:hypothetical protein